MFCFHSLVDSSLLDRLVGFGMLKSIEQLNSVIFNICWDFTVFILSLTKVFSVELEQTRKINSTLVYPLWLSYSYQLSQTFVYDKSNKCVS